MMQWFGHSHVLASGCGLILASARDFVGDPGTGRLPQIMTIFGSGEEFPQEY